MKQKAKRVKSVTYMIKTRVLYSDQRYKTGELRLEPPSEGNGYLAYFFPDGRLVLCGLREGDTAKAVTRMMGLARGRR